VSAGLDGAPKIARQSCSIRFGAFDGARRPAPERECLLDLRRPFPFATLAEREVAADRMRPERLVGLALDRE
jgi:hypothetical protein